ncbi:hypothetical protein ACEPAG_9410 [Sanghuangporus baumii]
MLVLEVDAGSGDDVLLTSISDHANMGKKVKGGVSQYSKSVTTSRTALGCRQRVTSIVASSNLAQRRNAVAAYRKAVAEDFVKRMDQQKAERAMFVDGFETLDMDLDVDNVLDLTDEVSRKIIEPSDDEGDLDVGEFFDMRYNKEAERQRKKIQAEHWKTLFPGLVDAYLQWDAHGMPIDDDTSPRHAPIKCFNVHDITTLSFPMSVDGSMGLTTTMMRHGYVACAPLHPELAISLELLRIYSVTNSRCGNVGVAPFVHSVCDLQSILFHHSYAKSFSRAFDVYVEVLHRIDAKIDVALRATTLSKLQDACPCCMLRVDGEKMLTHSMLICVDGNESLKRYRKMRQIGDQQDGALSVNVEMVDREYRASALYVEADMVDRYKNKIKQSGRKNMEKGKNLVYETTTTSATSIAPPDIASDESSPADIMDEKTPCTDRWTNLSADSQKRMWGTFDETGVFIATCRHGVVLSICDMIKSGELSKYPLALVDSLIDVTGGQMLVGYDIGCGFSKTLQRSSLVGAKARDTKTMFCVNAFHGHAHCRTCQLEWHPLYVDGAGLEDFEACERVFAQSNRIAGCTRHMSKFHRRQAIIRHFSRWNFDKYVELSTFLMNNLRQADVNIRTLSKDLKTAKTTLGIDGDDIFELWRNEELMYLRMLQNSSVSTEDKLAMDYVDILKRLKKASERYEAQKLEWIETSMTDLQRPSFYNVNSSKTMTVEEAARLGLDTIITLQGAARRLEDKLGIKERWTDDSDEWKKVDVDIAEQDYRKAIDRLEGLVVARLFELSKMNQAGTGYKLRVQISKALRARSEALRTALKTFNAAADILGRPTLQLSTVLEYVYLGQFDLLRCSRHDVMSKPWSRQAERSVMTMYYKLKRSHEEKLRVEIEITRLLKYIDQSDNAFRREISDLDGTDPLLAFQLHRRYHKYRQVNEVHCRRLSLVMKNNCKEIPLDFDESEDELSDDEDEGIVAVDDALNALASVDK